ncbi:SsgA family sporulation/cell division regulator [Streptomyces lancefieldiae]|uniref:SsgA family sporulation/cell division regulator n=1 Tax=Streptomyces lancefieldiae TaxID=3075520 RepID=A0ABU3AQN4_9ACTN|nr:SsgA family sporulation/cell division regulator [Streptomyces sp. DSM 40712]MDT0611897.1 SsgA family sporulation/cell division regulator [Streptomyces sp. DSM 40712]
MNSLVRKTLVVQLQTGGADRCPVLAHLSYDAADPFALTVVFSHDGRVLARWSLDREMVREGLARPVGVGDVRLRPESRGVWDELRVELLGDVRPDGGRHRAVVFVWAAAVEAFLRETHAVVRPGKEEVDVDDFLAEIMAEG